MHGFFSGGFCLCWQKKSTGWRELVKLQKGYVHAKPLEIGATVMMPILIDWNPGSQHPQTLEVLSWSCCLRCWPRLLRCLKQIKPMCSPLVVSLGGWSSYWETSGTDLNTTIWGVRICCCESQDLASSPFSKFLGTVTSQGTCARAKVIFFTLTEINPLQGLSVQAVCHRGNGGWLVSNG